MLDEVFLYSTLGINVESPFKSDGFDSRNFKDDVAIPSEISYYYYLKSKIEKLFEQYHVGSSTKIKKFMMKGGF